MAALGLMAIALIGVLTHTLIDGRSEARRELDRRFAERSRTAAQLIDALLESMSAQARTRFASAYGGPAVSARELETDRRRSNALYSVVVGENGLRLAATNGTPPAATQRAVRVASELRGQKELTYRLSPVLNEVGRPVMELMTPFETLDGLRVHVSGLAVENWSSFFDQTLSHVPGSEAAHAFVLDPKDRLLGDSGGTRRPGTADGGRIVAEAGGSQPATASSKVDGTGLRIVLTTPTASLHEPIGGNAGWVAWAFLALVIGGLGAGLWLMVRLVRSHEALRESEERHALALRGANDGLWDWDLDRDEIHYSERWVQMLGLDDANLGGTPDAWFERVHEDDLSGLEAAIDAHLEGESDFLAHEHRLRREDGTWIWVLARGLALCDDEGRPHRIAGSLTDVTDRRRAMARLEHQASHDPLTGLANRGHFFSLLERAIRRCSHAKGPTCAVVFIDLDSFKNINDRYGHVFGDELLTAVAQRLETSVRPGDIPGRLGGDELGVLLSSVADRAEATAVAARLSAALAEPYIIDDRSVQIGASAGVALAEGGYDAEDVLREADAAMYRAKLEA